MRALRHTWVYLSLALSCVSLLAASPAIDDKPPGPRLEPIEAQRYAQHLGRTIEQVRETYVRPVARAKLATAALRGLYESARLPVPPALCAEVQKAARDAYELHRLLVRVRESLGNPEPLRGPQALLASLQGMMEALDPFSAVLTGTELERTESPSGQQRGMGLELLPNAASLPLVIKTVTPGGPAQKAGLRPGDHITHIDGPLLTGSSGNPVQSVPEKAVHLEVYRPSTRASWRVTLTPANFRPETVLGVIRGPDNSWDYFLDREHRIAQVRIGSLEHGTAEDLARILFELTAAGMRGLILDLRWSPGGYLDQARDVGDLFIAGYALPRFVLPLPGNLLAVAQVYLDDYPKNARVFYRDPTMVDHHQTPAESHFLSFPMIVLINAETSGGAELVAAVLQDNVRAKIAGQRSRGKGSVQSIQGFKDIEMMRIFPRASLKLSTGMLLRPNGRNLHRFADSTPADDWGVRPDPNLEFRISADLGRQLREWWQLQDLRPGSSYESLPLDDPVADPQRQAALQVLLDMLR